MKDFGSRRFLKTFAVVGAATVILTACASGSPASGDGGASSAPTELNVLTFAGNLAKVNAEAAAGFEKKFNVKIKWTEGATSENLARVVASKGNQIYDVALLDDKTQYIGSQQGAWEDLDEKVMTNLPDIADVWRTKNGDGVGYGAIADSLFYNADAFKEKGWNPPTSYKDLLDSTFCKVTTIPDIVNITSIHAMLGLGVAAGETTLDAQFKSGVAQLKAHEDCFETFETTPGASDQKILTDKYLTGITGNVRSLPMQDAGKNIVTMKPDEGAYYIVSTVNVVKDAPHEKLAQEFANWFISPKAEDIQLAKAYYTPSNSKVVISDDMSKRGIISSDKLDEINALDITEVVDHLPDWVKEWNAAFSS